MKVIINPTLPLHIDKNHDGIRLGNLPVTGKIIEGIDKNLIFLLKQCIKPVDVNKLINLCVLESRIDRQNINETVNCLLNERYLVDYSDYCDILHNELFNRQVLFFSMFNSFSKATSMIKVMKEKRIVILGVGAIGCNVANQLIKAGINKLTLVDSDTVEYTNLHRQLLFKNSDVGSLKTDAAKRNLLEVNLNADIKTINIYINNEDNLEPIIKECDLVLCTMDKPTRNIVNNVCVRNDKSILFAGFSEYVGMIGPFIIPHKTACLKCIDSSINKNINKNINDMSINSDRIIPSFGPLCNCIASIATSEIIKYISGFTDSKLIGSTLMVDLINFKMELTPWHKNNECTICSK
ncbi:UBA/THIF-type NAD/FAD binding protein [Clostridium sp. DL-VIII]|uniref:HesA/MoeB/ThiF family protein n=1 Tax=Clostridium sp. DL-VIII TaxID=641107 RepID=UPI00023B02E8|nr:ThiF family adenylyltransferase [Clostridium sp. DL-VIII]EHJ01782.1 UBA/THIF-type NAD/FAD binding protein [Clostridium sp. DL-VIII]